MSEYLVLRDGRVLGPVDSDQIEPIWENDRITGYIFKGVLATLTDLGPDPRWHHECLDKAEREAGA